MEISLENGFVKIPRLFLQTPIWQSRSAALRTVAITCLLKANHKDAYWNQVIIKRGSFVTSQRKLAQECFIHRRTLRDCLHTLEHAHFLTHEHAHNYTTISLLNYDIYQGNTRPATRPATRPKWYNPDPTGGINGAYKQEVINKNKNDSSQSSQKPETTESVSREDMLKPEGIRTLRMLYGNNVIAIKAKLALMGITEAEADLALGRA